MNLIYRLFHKRFADKIARIGLGPFIPATLISLLSGVCNKCGRPVHESSLFGNSVYIENHLVKIICQHCRLGLTYSQSELSGVESMVNRSLLLVGLWDFIKGQEAKNINWIRVILALRNNLGFFQRNKDYKTAFYVKMENTTKDLLYANDPLYGFEYGKPIQNIYGSMSDLGNCGDCGATITNSGKLEDGNYNLPYCWSCHMPNQHQWNMRFTFEEEERMLNSFRKARTFAKHKP